MPDLDKGQHGSVPIVLERSLADVQYSAHVPVVQQVRDFGLRAEILSHTKSQLFDAFFSSSQAEVSMAVNLIINLVFNCRFSLFGANVRRRNPCSQPR